MTLVGRSITCSFVTLPDTDVVPLGIDLSSVASGTREGNTHPSETSFNESTIVTLDFMFGGEINRGEGSFEETISVFVLVVDGL